MSIDRRMFERTDVAVTGDLLWQVKRRSGLVKTHRVEITTFDLSVDGARVSTSKATRLPTGASVLLTFNGETSAARVRGHLPDPNKKRGRLLLLQFDEPSAEFLRVIDMWIEAGKGGTNEFKSAYWSNLDSEEEFGPGHEEIAS